MKEALSRHPCLVLGSLVLVAVSGLSSEAESDLLSGVRRVVVLGDSITYGGGYVAAIEAYALDRKSVV